MKISLVTDNCETFCRNITAVVFHPAPDEAVHAEVGERLRRILNSTDEEILLYRKDFDPALFNNAPEDLKKQLTEHASKQCEEGHKSKNGICPSTGLPCMVQITHPQQFLTGKQLGQLIIKARRGRLTEKDFFNELFKLMSGSSDLVTG